MSIVTALVHPDSINDELTALTLQFEELGVYSETRKGKHPAGQLQNIQVVYNQLLAELRDYKAFLDDQRLAQSIGEAVHSDGFAIAEISLQNAQIDDDYRLALELSTDDLENEQPPSVCDTPDADILAWRDKGLGGIAATSVTELSDEETEACSSIPYAERQAETLKKFSVQFDCCAYADQYPQASLVMTQYEHRYCIECIKSLFMRSTHDESLYPPRCCKQPIPLALVAKYMTLDEIEAFELSAMEYTTHKRTYCSNIKCSRFPVPESVEPGTKRVICPDCTAETCAICSNTYHADSDCPEDTALDQTRELARNTG